MLREKSVLSVKSDKKAWELPCETQSLCPVCLKVIDAELYEEDGQVLMRKSCGQDGNFRELISSDAEFFLKMRRTHYDRPSGVANPNSANQSHCPDECGLYEQHLSTPAMVNIDLTNRCNQNCPICFASSNATGRVCELSLEQVQRMLQTARSIKPHPPSCLQYVGGEPTIYPNFLEAVRLAKPLGFAQIQAASNGVRFAESPEFAEAVEEAGLDLVYLQFDGLSDRIYKKMRGRALLETKMRAIENLGKAGIRVMLVPTIVKGTNDDNLGEILRFAIEHADVIAGISWQPVAITGRIDESKRREMRFTLADLARCLQEQTGIIDMHRDWYPFSIVAPFVRLMEIVNGQPQLRLSCHPHCGCVTYLVIDRESGQATPLPAIIDIEPAMEMVDRIAARIERHRWLKNISVLQAMKSLRKYFHQDHAPKGWGFEHFLEFVRYFTEFDQVTAGGKDYISQLRSSRYRLLLLAAMHFQDAYNYEVERSRRCVILYSAPNGRLYPFCTWNSGPCHRYGVERQFARPIAQVAEHRRRLHPTEEAVQKG
jgi:hypothetical protein